MLNVNKKYKLVPLEDDNEILLNLDSDTISVPSHTKKQLCLLPKINTSQNHVSCHSFFFFLHSVTITPKCCMIIMTAVYNCFSSLKGFRSLYSNVVCGDYLIYHYSSDTFGMRFGSCSTALSQKTRTEWVVYGSKYNHPPDRRPEFQD